MIRAVAATAWPGGGQGPGRGDLGGPTLAWRILRGRSFAGQQRRRAPGLASPVLGRATRTRWAVSRRRTRAGAGRKDTAQAATLDRRQTGALIAQGWEQPGTSTFRNHGQRVRTMVALAKELGYPASVGALQGNFGTPVGTACDLSLDWRSPARRWRWRQRMRCCRPRRCGSDVAGDRHRRPAAGVVGALGLGRSRRHRRRRGRATRSCRGARPKPSWTAQRRLRRGSTSQRRPHPAGWQAHAPSRSWRRLAHSQGPDREALSLALDLHARSAAITVQRTLEAADSRRSPQLAQAGRGSRQAGRTSPAIAAAGQFCRPMSALPRRRG